jgi:hypothetical protein
MRAKSSVLAEAIAVLSPRAVDEEDALPRRECTGCEDAQRGGVCTASDATESARIAQRVVKPNQIAASAIGL